VAEYVDNEIPTLEQPSEQARADKTEAESTGRRFSWRTASGSFGIDLPAEPGEA